MLRVALLVTGLLAGLAFLTSLGNGFVYDDVTIVRDNPLVTEPSRMGEIWTTPYWGSRAGGGLFRPMTTFSYALNHRVGGLEPFGYHLVNLLLHVAASLLVVTVALEYLPLAGIAVAGILFAVHPVHTEAVANVVGRAELMAAIGFLLAWGWWGRPSPAVAAAGLQWPGRTGARRLLAASAFAFSLLSKESAILLPVALLGRDFVKRQRPDWPGYGILALVIGLYIALRIHVLGAIGNSTEVVTQRLDNVIATQSFLPGLWTALSVFGRYVVLLIFPWRLSADYSYPQIMEAGPAEPWSWFGLLALAALGALSVMAFRHRRSFGVASPGVPPAGAFRAAAAAGLLIFAATILPVSNFSIRIGTVMAERLLYLPSAGAMLLLAAGASTLWQKPGLRSARPVMIGALLVLVVVGATRCLARSLDWRDNLALHSSTLRTSPRSARAQFNMAPTLSEQDRVEEAIAHLRRATELDPGYSEAWVNLAGYLIKEGRMDEAREALVGAARSEPTRRTTHLLSLGALEHRVGNTAGAISFLEKAAIIDSTLSGVWFDLGLFRSQVGDTAGAIEAYRRAARLEPRDAKAHNNLAWLLAVTGVSPDEAVEHGRRAVSLRPDGDSWDTLAEALLRAGRRDEAIEAWKNALRIGLPNAEQVRSRLARLEGTTGD